MSVMDRIAKLDSSLQRGLDNGFAFVFGGKVVPGEVDDLITQQAEDNLARGDGDWIEAPNVYLVTVSRKDFDNLRSTHPDLPREAAGRMSRWCRNQGFVTLGPVIVQVRQDTGLRTGQLGSRSRIDPSPGERTGYVDDTGDSGQPEPRAPESVDRADVPAHPEPDAPASDVGHTPAPAVGPSSVPVPGAAAPTEHLAPRGPVQHAPLVTLLLQDGSSRTYLVQEGSNIIGRGTDVDFRLPDMGVSRRHAEVMWDGRDAVLVDLHSTNGTTVNDTDIDNWLLADGDVIKVGHSYIEVRVTGG
ncbi:DUF3662 and FHA domain-containing protein [Corynebacterium pygosceleis]|uniref:DUF3662 domain-containing protein n=1 Tax=Corynebacterium pygosceleis TaxID=2800406 RepID=A0A9Q4C7M0_9CORY|nr:DUF3662 and FHA domain-containing protein [Corynebacterium pygosceleis]MCK7637238.1 DUF3662 domain-containing protein [Corynebacterium pygosceleis]MCK7676175.1 DUF3662 domain-containing protein [Corynebacterium pygosceleis]MCL0119987.1 DUF3662 domain-containing protein [Corynebacterium pygosceleis]MCX7445141.1 DUF3662 domain-containing protein [Corynebacterium pygosceleis]MCX7468434.1 DUF3662 domain-containing protein [Corynebacterium pygosceleis]